MSRWDSKTGPFYLTMDMRKYHAGGQAPVYTRGARIHMRWTENDSGAFTINWCICHNQGPCSNRIYSIHFFREERNSKRAITEINRPYQIRYRFNCRISNPVTVKYSCISVQTLTDEEILGNAFVFIMAGHETAANSVHLCLGLLAMNIVAQRRLHADLDEIFQGRPVNESEYEGVIPKLFRGMAGAVLNEELQSDYGCARNT